MHPYRYNNVFKKHKDQAVSDRSEKVELIHLAINNQDTSKLSKIFEMKLRLIR